MNDLVRACPMCGEERRVYKCECTSPGRIDPIDMPRAAAERIRELTQQNWTPRRLTASPRGVTLWVQEEGSPLRPVIGIWLRPRERRENPAAAAGARDNWFHLTTGGWHELRDCVDKYLASLSKTNEPKGTAP